MESEELVQGKRKLNANELHERKKPREEPSPPVIFRVPNQQSTDGQLFVNQPIDLSRFDVGIRCFPVMTEYISYMVNYMMSESGYELEPLLQLQLQKSHTEASSSDRETIVTNIISGRTQLGKTKLQAAMLYIFGCTLGLIGIALVRSSGGDESIASLEDLLKDISQRVITSLSKKFGELPYYVVEFFKPQIVTVEQYYNGKADVKEFGHMHRPLIIIGRQNVSSFKKLFRVGVTQNDSKHRYLVDWLQKSSAYTNSYVLVCDEDDVVHSTPSRLTTVTEKASMAPNQAHFRENIDSDEPISFCEIVAIPSIRSAAQLVIAVSATWFANVLTHDTTFRQLIKVIAMPISKDYVGFSSKPDAPHRKVVLRQVDKSEVAKEPWIAHEDAIKEMFTNCTERYKQRQHHISVHINTNRTYTNILQDEFAKILIEQYGQKQPMIAFCFNQLAQKRLFLSRALVKCLQERHGPKTSAWIIDTVRQCTQEPRLCVDVKLCDVTSVTFGMSKKPRISVLYDIVVKLFQHTRPYMICITGALGGRQLTLKDSQHRYVLTDMYMDCSNQTHFERLIQTAGRICSKDPYETIERYLWAPSWIIDRLQTAVAFYDQMEALCVENPMCVFKELINSVTATDSAIVRTLNLRLAITRSPLMRPMWFVIKQLSQTATDHLAHARVLERLLHRNLEGLAVHDITKQLKVKVVSATSQAHDPDVFYVWPEQMSKIKGLVSTACKVARDAELICLVDKDDQVVTNAVQGCNYRWKHRRYV